MPYYYFPAINHLISWGTITGNLLNQSDLINYMKNNYISEFYSFMDFSKYEEIQANEFIFPQIIFLNEGISCSIVGYTCQTTVGTVNLNLRKNREPIGQLSSIIANTELKVIMLEEPIALNNLDIIFLEINSSEEARNLLFRLIIKFEKNDEN